MTQPKETSGGPDAAIASSAQTSNEFVSIISPTFREAENIRSLVEEIHDAMTEAGLPYELIVVDDNSQDGIIEAAEELVAEGFPLRLLVRTNERGLSSAVLHGFANATGGILVCIDADLSHPPTDVPRLVARLKQSDADFVIGSRYVPGGGTDEDWGFFRYINSQVATLLARPFTSARDPMAGFFALTKESLENAAKLNPVGYKIGLELIVKCNCQQVREEPIHFSDRRAGESKLSLKEQLNYLRHLGRLAWFKVSGR